MSSQKTDSKKERKNMKIYIIERDNPTYKPEPQVYTDGKIALKIVEKEYKNKMKDFKTNQEKANAGYGSCGCYWNFIEGGFCGDALIDRDSDGDRWEWRITEHELEI